LFDFVWYDVVPKPTAVGVSNFTTISVGSIGFRLIDFDVQAPETPFAFDDWWTAALTLHHTSVVTNAPDLPLDFWLLPWIVPPDVGARSRSLEISTLSLLEQLRVAARLDDGHDAPQIAVVDMPIQPLAPCAPAVA
jgi:hypothetical protein